MKKLFTLLVLTCSSPFIGFVFADSTVLTMSDMMIKYYEEVAPLSNPDLSGIVVKMPNVQKDSRLYQALQKSIYFGLIKNTNRVVDLKKNATERDLTLLIRKHFGSTVSGDRSTLTVDEYEAYMTLVRESFAYAVIRGNFDSSEPEETTTNLTSSNNFNTLDSVYTLLHDNYLRTDDLKDRELIYGASEGMVKALNDPFSQFLRPADSKDFYNALDGTVVGIGIVIDETSTDGIKIASVMPGTPAEKAGLKAADVITHVDGVKVNNKDGLDDEISRIRGSAGAKVEITYTRAGKTSVISIVRKEIHIELVEQENLGDSFVLTYREVGFGTSKKLRTALDLFLKSGKKRLILDLRNNPGGSLDETRKILNFFIDKDKPLFAIQDRKNIIPINADKAQMVDWSKYEIVILMNNGSASAAEVIASALREYFPKTLIILGDKSYGKGTVQELATLPDESTLKYTIARWLTPIKQVSYDHNGIVPDVALKFDENLWKTKREDNQLQAAVSYKFSK